MKNLIVKITPNYVCGYTVDSSKCRSDLQILAAAQNFEKAYTVGKMSDSVAKKIKDRLMVWLLGINFEKSDRNKLGMTVPEYPTFITLTLSKEQEHSDEYIKRELLGRFIETLRLKYGVVNYYWRAEKKVGKRIHFHLIVDKFIHWKNVRLEWNYRQCQCGYHGIINLNGTDLGCNSTDIDKVNGSEQLVHYISDYVAKNEDNEVIEGRIWGCSSGLHRIGACCVIATREIQEAYVKLLLHKGVNQKVEDTYTILTWKNKVSLMSLSYGLFKIYREYCLHNYRSLYCGSTAPYSSTTLQEGVVTVGIRQVCPKITQDDKMQFQYSLLNTMFANEKKMSAYNEFDCCI